MAGDEINIVHDFITTLPSLQLAASQEGSFPQELPRHAQSCIEDLLVLWSQHALTTPNTPHPPPPISSFSALSAL